jgi:hypothetical protein
MATIMYNEDDNNSNNIKWMVVRIEVCIQSFLFFHYVPYCYGMFSPSLLTKHNPNKISNKENNNINDIFFTLPTNHHPHHSDGISN